MSELREHIAQLRELALGTPGASRLFDLTTIEVLEELAARLEELDAGLQMFSEALTFLGRRLAQHAARPDHDPPDEGSHHAT